MPPMTFHAPNIPCCPYCGMNVPHAQLRGNLGAVTNPTTQETRHWGAIQLNCCGSYVLARSHPFGRANPDAQHVLANIYPPVKSPAVELPPNVRQYLDQSFKTLHAPDAAAVMAGSAVDAMLKHLGLEKGTIYERINQAVQKHILTAGMGEWAHSVRLGANRPRHADKESPHVTPEEARQSVEFAEALGDFLFVLNAKIEKGKAAAVPAAPPVAETS